MIIYFYTFTGPAMSPDSPGVNQLKWCSFKAVLAFVLKVALKKNCVEDCGLLYQPHQNRSCSDESSIMLRGISSQWTELGTKLLSSSYFSLSWAQTLCRKAKAGCVVAAAHPNPAGLQKHRTNISAQLTKATALKWLTVVSKVPFKFDYTITFKTGLIFMKLGEYFCTTRSRLWVKASYRSSDRATPALQPHHCRHEP